MSNPLLITVVLIVCAALGSVAIAPYLRRHGPPTTLLASTATGPAVAIGTVRSTAEPFVVVVESVTGQRFVGGLRPSADPVMSALRPGHVVLVAFDPNARERLSLADDISAVRAEFDRMLIGKGLLSTDQLELIRNGTRSRGVVTGMRTTGATREDHREVELDLMVRRPGGGQFPARERTLIPLSALADVKPGSVVDTYYRSGDESAVAVCVTPG